MDLRLTPLEHDGACVHCGTSLPAGTLAWWDPAERAFTCTTCVPPGESSLHSIAHEREQPPRRRAFWR